MTLVVAFFAGLALGVALTVLCGWPRYQAAREQWRWAEIAEQVARDAVERERDMVEQFGNRLRALQQRLRRATAGFRPLP